MRVFECLGIAITDIGTSNMREMSRRQMLICLCIQRYIFGEIADYLCNKGLDENVGFIRWDNWIEEQKVK